MFTSTMKDGSVLLSVHVQPKSSRNRIAGIYDQAVKVNITAPPVDGKANKAMVSFLSDFFGITKKDVTLHAGAQARKKRFILSGISEREVRDRVLEEIES